MAGPFGVNEMVCMTMADVLKLLYQRQWRQSLARADSPLKAEVVRAAHVLAHSSALLEIAGTGVSGVNREAACEELRAVIEKHFGLFHDDAALAWAPAAGSEN